MNAQRTANPTAADDKKFWTVKPKTCVLLDSANSPEYACQFVLVIKLTAVLSAKSKDRLS